MTTNNQKPTLAEVLQEMRYKIDQAKRSVKDMEEAKEDHVHFIERLNDYLSAAGRDLNN